MKFSAIILSLAASAVALPSSLLNQGDAPLGGHKFPIPSDMTIGEAQAKCGDQAELSCCNKASYSGDTTHVGGTLSNLIGAGSAAEGAGLFDQCSKLPIQIPVLLLLGINDVLDQQCKQNVACCQHNGGSADDSGVGVSIPCVALGSIL
ncbi:hypothetical protein ASPWEDRAFT_34285 [Aspergillus wentii DTO 134E9]|uniref:Hydrophobin n=1 Tax=Aspergillus wentii DTO 134E9 TaxID=1073089 RepID=A0A1L9S0V7_ASPWE|nr:uncharacterized protein ASPWEDRAFT_34285 [Aspergillus wentii DTO 134E9]KAI9931190.1 hypothetical protein MW887_010850 [Aspergillus wentii]OJJ40802.1 hypothetical protein ASPWEDRAFT_34285 [Aspergillus wentii DTO 134E9]